MPSIFHESITNNTQRDNKENNFPDNKTQQKSFEYLLYQKKKE